MIAVTLPCRDPIAHRTPADTAKSVADPWPRQVHRGTLSCVNFSVGLLRLNCALCGVLAARCAAWIPSASGSGESVCAGPVGKEGACHGLSAIRKRAQGS